MSHLEYLVAIAYYLGKLDKEELDYDIDGMDVEDLLNLSQLILEQFYAQREFAYISEFLEDMEPRYFDELCEQYF